VDRTVDLLQDLLDLGRNLGQNGSTTYNLKPVMLNDLIESAVRSVDLEGDRQIELEAEMLITAQAEVKALHRVLVHLLKNAQQFSQPDQPIRIRLAQSGNLAIIQVIDQGCGIAAADQPHLFEPFYRVEQSRCRATGGMGLGLAIVKHVIQRHGGHLRIESKLNLGSCFTLC
jgi:signal transduction histidine kinase